MSEAQQLESQEAGTSKFYYTIADHNILLESGIKTEIIEKQNAFPIPHSPTWCQGMISLRGKLIPVANLHKMLKQSEQSQSSWLLVLEKSPYPQLAIRIDRLPQQQLISDNDARTELSGTLPKWLTHSLKIDDKALLEADHTLLFEQLIQQNENPSESPSDKEPPHNLDSSGKDA